MTDSSPETPQAGQSGWFEDPDNPTYKRFWDGEEWSDHRVIKAQIQKSEPPAFRPGSAPGPAAKAQEHKIVMGQIALGGQPPIDPRGGDGLLIRLLRAVFGDYRDPRQRTGR